jgi:hypothetical protein
MKKLLLTGLLLTVAGSQAAINFDFWNKTNQPLYFEIGTEQYPPEGKHLTLINATNSKDTSIQSRILKGLQYGAEHTLDIKSQGDFAQIKDVDTSRKTLILLSRSAHLKPGDKAVLITVNPHKDIFLRIKEDSKGMQLFAGDNRKYLVGPQTGPLGGWIGKTERGLPLANIIKQTDISINPNYIITEKPLSAKEAELEKALESEATLTPAQIESLKELGITGDLDE